MNEEYNNKQILEDEKQIDLCYWTIKSLEIKSLVIKKPRPTWCILQSSQQLKELWMKVC